MKNANPVSSRREHAPTGLGARASRPWTLRAADIGQNSAAAAALAPRGMAPARRIKTARLLAFTTLLGLTACGRSHPDKSPSLSPLPAAGAPIATYTCEVLHVWPHDRGAFTQGLVVRNGEFIESTGLNGESTLREVEIATGRVLKQIEVPRQYFAEGAVVLNGKVFQLTWQNHTGFIYDADTFRKLGEFQYEGEGWGLTTDGQSLILSDGTNRIRFLEPTTFRVTRSINVLADGKPVERLNELEFVRGEILANVWQTNDIVRVDAATGQVRGRIDCTGLLAPQDRSPDTDVLNGIAYEPETDRLFITGKRWPKMFEVRVKTK